jgi:hypothetical protein
VGGSGTTNFVPKFSNTGTPAVLTDSLIFDNGTSVGIGTITPNASFKIDVVGSIKASQFGHFGNSQVRINTSTSGYVDLYDGTERKMLIGDGATDIAGFRTYNGNVFRFDNNQDFIPLQLARFSSQIIVTGGANIHSAIESSPIVNSSGGTTLLRGFYYNPTFTITGGTVTNIAFENVNGDIIHGNLATGGAAQMVTADSTGKLGIQTIPSGGGGTVTSIATSSPITGGTITNTGTIGITQATTASDGYLSQGDWNTFNNKVDKSQAAYTMLANNTNGTADMTAQAFQDPGTQTYTGSIAWTGGIPTGTPNHTYAFTQIGKMVTLVIRINYSGAPATNNTQVLLSIPTDAPAPFIPTGLSNNNEFVYPGVGYLFTATTTPSAIARAGIKRNSTNTASEIVIISGAAALYRAAWAQITYWTA